MQNDPRLHSRLRNCLQTILELEPDLEVLRMNRVLSDEFAVLKDICARLGRLSFHEDDVERIEKATAHFLCELRSSMTNSRMCLSGQRILQ